MTEITERSLRKSFEYLARAERIIPAGTQTFSKGPTQYVQGVAPAYLQSGRGSHVLDVDGNDYIDYVMGLGPVTLGYGYPRVDEAIRRQLEEGITFSLMHPLEVELSELLVDLIPCAEMVRFGKNGSDATAGAVRAARAYTGREKIACGGYHGWQDWYIGTTTRSKGVPRSTRELTIPFEYNNIESLRRIFAENKDEIAAVIMEPIIIAEPEDNFLPEVKELTHQNGAVLIFDEIVTGFRIALGGAQEYYGVTPDLATFGKGMANGMPISALVGRGAIMKEFDEVFYSFTFGGEALSLAAAMATIEEMREKDVIRHLRRQGEKLKNGYNELAQLFGLLDYTKCIGLPEHSAIHFVDKEGNESLEMKSLFQQELLKRGILTIGVHIICFSHSDKDVAQTLEAYGDAMRVLRQAIDEGDIERYLEGRKVQPVIRKRT
jgi:glutamate-1-semialdehyde aminotransferase